MTKRPGSNCPKTLTLAAMTAGVRVYTGVTATPMRMDCVCCATAAT